MEKKYPNHRRISMVVLLCMLLILFVKCAAKEASNLDNDLRAIRHAKKENETEWAKSETRCLKLIEDHNSPAEKGKIYSTLALMYSDGGYQPGNDPKVAKTIKYSMKALEYPLDPLAACYMYARGSDAIMIQSLHDPNKTFIDVRRKAIDLCLKGLKLAIDSNAPTEYPKPPPGVSRVDIAPGSPFYERLMEEHRRQIEAREKWRYETDFYWLRRGLFERCVSLYSRKPYDQETFKKKTQEILKEHGDIAKELIAALDAQIEKLKAASNENSKKTPKEPAKDPPANSTQH